MAVPSAEADSQVTTGTVTEVVDGDTVKVDGRSVRLIGMDTPEVGEPSGSVASLVGSAGGRSCDPAYPRVCIPPARGEWATALSHLTCANAGQGGGGGGKGPLAGGADLR